MRAGDYSFVEKSKIHLKISSYTASSHSYFDIKPLSSTVHGVGAAAIYNNNELHSQEQDP